MGRDTAIEWADDTVNFWTGCTQVGPGCDNCYAMHLAQRFGTVAWNGPPVPRVEKAIAELYRLNRLATREGRTRVVFINSMSDAFDNQAADAWRCAMFSAIEDCPNLTCLILTKRIGNVLKFWRDFMNLRPWPANARLGISVVNQEEADRDCHKLLAIKYILRIRWVFLSVEPMLGAIDLEQAWHGENALTSECWGDCAWCSKGHPPLHNCRKGLNGDRAFEADRSGIDWVICGGESQSGARPMHPDWARSLRDQCKAAGVPFFFKQWGEFAPAEGTPGSIPPGNYPSSVICFDGEHLKGRNVLDRQDDDRAEIICRFGKHNSGRLLDGVEHNERPDL